MSRLPAMKPVEYAMLAQSHQLLCEALGILAGRKHREALAMDQVPNKDISNWRWNSFDGFVINPYDSEEFLVSYGEMYTITMQELTDYLNS